MNTRSKILAITLFEGIRLITEEGEMPTQAPAPAAGPAMPPPAASPDPAAQQSPGTPMGADGKPLTVDSIIDRLNVIRGGKSFSDPEVYGQLTSMFKGMPDQEKLNLDQVLMNIGNVVQQQDQATANGEQPKATTSAPPQPAPTPAPGASPAPAAAAAPVTATP